MDMEARGNAFMDKINSVLTIPNSFKFEVLDLFAGCGGLSLGFEAAGFKSAGFEMDKACCETYELNLNGKCVCEILHKGYKFPSAEVLMGGPPCQPFSVRGKQNGLNDTRNGFPIFIEAVRQVKPRLFLIENVRGLLYKNKSYLNDVINELAKIGYVIDIKMINVAHFGVPQNRERVFIVGHYGGFEFPRKEGRIVTAGEALGDLARTHDKNSKFLTPQMDAYIARYERASECVVPRDLHLNKPARTLTCRNLAAPTSDMHRIRLPDGRRRRLTVMEAARLQSFPDWFEFKGNETSAFNQIGNAVPPYFAFQLAQKVKEYLSSEGVRRPSQKRRMLIQSSLIKVNDNEDLSHS